MSEPIDLSQFEGDSPYHRQGQLYSFPDLLEAAAQSGNTLAERLEAGDTSPIPDGVREWLSMHTMGVDAKGPGTVRNIIEHQLTSASDEPSLPQRLGGLIRYAIKLGNEFSLHFELTEMENKNIIDQM